MNSHRDNVEIHSLLVNEMPDRHGDLYVQQYLFEFHLLEALPTEIQLNVWKLTLPARRNRTSQPLKTCPCVNCYSCRTLDRLQRAPLPAHLKICKTSRAEALLHYSLIARCQSGFAGATKTFARLQSHNYIFAAWCFYSHTDENDEILEGDFLLLIKADQQSAILMENIEHPGYNGIFWCSYMNTASHLRSFWKPLAVPFSTHITANHFMPFKGSKEFRVLDMFDNHLLPSQDKEDGRPIAEDFIFYHRDELFGTNMRENIEVRPWGAFVFVEE